MRNTFFTYHDGGDHVRGDGVPQTVTIGDSQTSISHPSHLSLHFISCSVKLYACAKFTWGAWFMYIRGVLYLEKEPLVDKARMSSFCREDFAVRSKSELLDYIEQQSDQISRLETRFRG